MKAKTTTKLQAQPNASAPGRLIYKTVWRAFSLWYGMTAAILLLLSAFTTKKKFLWMSEEEKKELATAQSRYWDLSKRPDGINHGIHVTKNGFKLHYAYTIPQGGIKEDTGLVVFLHGFPDSWLLWKHFLKTAKLNEKAVLIAVDLPGYGGSDSLQKYTPTDALDILTEFILAMRHRYTVDSTDADDKSKVLIVAHDWGAAIAFKLAAEAPQLADRFIIAGAVHLPHIIAGIKEKYNTATRIFRSWLKNPTQIGLLKKAASSIYPVFLQLGKSYYIFVFNIPSVIASRITFLGDWWVFRFLNAFTFEQNPSEPIKGAMGAEILASSMGPSERECIPAEVKTSDGATTTLGYGESVRRRTRNAGWFEKISIYRDGMFTQRWDKSLEVMWELSQLEQRNITRRRSSGTNSGIFENGPKGSLKAPVTVIWGKNDIAMTYRMATEGLGDFFACRSSQIVMLPRVGHWSPHSKPAQGVWTEVISWALDGGEGTLKERFGDGFPCAQIQFER